MRRNASKWHEMTRLTTDLTYTRHQFPMIAVCNSHVLVLMRWQGNLVYVFKVSAEHSVRNAGSLQLWRWSGYEEWMGLDCTRIGDVTYVAVSHRVPDVVQLLPLEWYFGSPKLSLFQRHTHDFYRPGLLLFRGDLLLVADCHSSSLKDAIVSFRVSGDALTEQKKLLVDAAAASDKNGIDVGVWTVSGNRLVLWDQRKRALLTYAFA